MAAIFLILMLPSVSGVYLHEWLGVIIGGGLVAHLLLNRIWIANVTHKFFGPLKPKLRLTYLINLSLGLAMLLTMISGILISQYLFTPLNASDLGLWTTIHAVSSRATFLFLLAHILLHQSWIRKTLQTAAGKALPQKLGAAFSRAVLGIFALGAAYAAIRSSIISPILATARPQLSEQTGATLSPAVVEMPASETTIQDLEEGTSVIEALPAPASPTTGSDGRPAATEPLTLQDYLSRFTCTACGRHCLLSAPRCNRSQPQIQQATAEYEALYGEP
jgi:hypothetical protein